LGFLPGVSTAQILCLFFYSINEETIAIYLGHHIYI
jgi:hypothetical protein